MSELSAAAQQAVKDFQGCQQWEQRARLLLQLGAQLEELPEDLREPDNLVQGCETRVWLRLDQRFEPPRFQLASEARLLRGLLALLLLRIDGLSAEQIATVDLSAWFSQLGLSKQLSPSRSNGLNAVLERMRALLKQPI
ncbi:SufE family protein [Pseudomonas sp. C27(2019)]|uniref:SufE family protein n=1 Tax=Pseudomonas sp. C27(2019) TaxID=2604941 RepID=UPI0012489E02|nr:SufE family protein [Pseudomonas sp. C27(2019)]QEY58259.1 SufE family protein [Pseudomonas sp. C27(2019)]